MGEQQYERDQQTIGRYEVLMYGQRVAMIHSVLESMYTLEPAEALMFLEWLKQHREELREAAKAEEAVKMVHAHFC